MGREICERDFEHIEYLSDDVLGDFDITVYFWEKFDEDTGDEIEDNIREIRDICFDSIDVQDEIKEKIIEELNSHKYDLFSIAFEEFEMLEREKLINIIKKYVSK